jgi:transcriptional regulator with XRE-family HTH domain
MPERGHGERGSFDASAFFSALDAERQVRRMTWKQVADEAGISQSTFTRLAQGRRPDVDSLAVLVDWAGLKADDFVVRVHSVQHATPLAMISAYLKSDRSLTPEAASALEKVVKVTYEALRQA